MPWNSRAEAGGHRHQVTERKHRMNSERQIGVKSGDPRLESVDFRHLAAFQRVYQEKNYTNAGQRIFATRKSIVRMMQNLEKSFGCVLFHEGLRGELHASAFAERLYNDLRFLNAARHRMKDHIAAVHEQGRILHVGSSSMVFRTGEFRNLFRELQSLDGIRICYSPVESADAGKALVSGICDLYIGAWTGTANRFSTSVAGNVAYRTYRRAAANGSVEAETHVVLLDECGPELPRSSSGKEKWRTLESSKWLYWLDHPDECPESTVIFGPDVEIDPRQWVVTDAPSGVEAWLPIHASFLRQHPYEFLPALARRFQNHTRA